MSYEYSVRLRIKARSDAADFVPTGHEVARSLAAALLGHRIVHVGREDKLVEATVDHAEVVSANRTRRK
jgi:hypothetical protein